MMKPLLVAVLLAAGATVYAAKADPRLALLRSAWIEPVDELSNDVAVAACLGDRLNTLTPMTKAATKAEADVILRVEANLPGKAKRAMLGGIGGTPSAHLYATMPDGAKLWDDGAKYRRGTGTIGLSADPTCGLASGLLNALREAMQKARDGKR